MKRRNLLCQLIGFTLVWGWLVGCNEAHTRPPLRPGPSDTALASSQTFTIIPAYEGLAAYVEAAQAAPQADWQPLFRQHVVEPYWQDCAAGGEYVRLAREAVATPIDDLTYLTSAVRQLRAAKVEPLVEATLREAAAILAGPNTTLCIFALDPQLTFVRDYMHGVAGLTVGSGKIWLQIYPQGAWRDWLPYTVAHEYHHSVWTDRHHSQGNSFDLVDYLVFEGRADAFARLLYPDTVAPWTEALTPAQERAQWQALQPHLETRSLATQGQFMFGASDVPRWTGYTIGFHIVQSYRHQYPEATVAEWTAMEAHDLLAESGYQGEEGSRSRRR